MRLVDADKIHRELTALYKNAQREARQAYSRAIDIVCDADTVEAEPVRHGRFIFEKGDGVAFEDGWICTACKFGYHTNVPYFESFAYCPNCGAKMERG